MTANVDAYAQCSARFGENQSGDAARLFYGEDAVTAVLVGGDGEAMHACVLAGMVASMLGSALSHPVAVDEAVATVVDMLPKGGSTASVLFTVAQIRADGAAYLARLSMPSIVFLRRGRVLPFSAETHRCGSYVFEETRMRLKPRDTLICFGNGVAQAGDGVPYAPDWSGTLLPAYLEMAYTPSVPARKIGELLLSVSNSLCGDKPQNDLSVAVLRYRPVQEV
ncbi:SpoIIE family protein phosphatase [Ethanoligenens sp.]|uniref:SpoIIE family protein phosphatase n=1 Tax=Ethanoligenens sp. TaxID=2099655 RepID=UPI0039E7A3E3